jgi:hypothetical protein
MSGLPVNWKQTLHNCNFFMARRGISYVFRTANEQAEREGKEAYWKKEIANGWSQFAENPCYDTAVRFLMVAPNMATYFDGSVQKSLYPAIWTAKTFSLENYRLLDKTFDIKELNELPPQKHASFPRQFKGEVIYNATPINFMGRQWKVMVSSVQGKIYKWAASLEVGRDEDFESIGNEVIEYCVRWLGATTEEKAGYLFWDTPDGNVILQLTNMDNWFDIGIFVTSREVRGLDKLYDLKTIR